MKAAMRCASRLRMSSAARRQPLAAAGVSVAEPASVGVRRGRVQRREEEGAVGLVEEIDVADAHRADGVAVIAPGEAEEGCFFGSRIRLLSPVLEGDLEGDFHGAGAGVRVEHVAEPGRGDFHEFFGQPDRGYVGKTEERAVGDLVQLPAYGGVDFPDTVAMDVAPHGRIAVEVPVTVDVLQVDAVPARDDNGVLACVRAHLGERVPDDAAVQVFEAGLVFGDMIA